ncbi:sensor histidine kinase [Hymenobacter crusticola]|uniref:histidine kinase n=1 Tax=Hymenobacter crusticola TaxID=1770526 RepID=A0A243WBD8_9BACT|nr:sensor histidine kinase [Hymenobacter crusticola]OUJ72921.1 hypothetical protein BXP70_16620 [Hymenobacter crusticola]
MAESDDTALQNHNQNAEDSLKQLRQRAERRRELATQSTSNRTSEEISQVLQELQTHQIELEMQYEELLQVQSEAQTARIQYEDLYEFAPIGYLLLTSAGVIQQLNLAVTQLLRTVRQRLQKRRFLLFITPNYRDKFLTFWGEVQRSEHRQVCELELQPEVGEPIFVRLEGISLTLPLSQAPLCRLAIIDITQQHKTTQALIASEARFRMLFEQSSDAVVLLQNDRYIDCNAAALRLLGTRHKSDLVGHSFLDNTPERQPNGQRTHELFREAVEQAVVAGSKRYEVSMYRFTGEKIWMEAVLTPIRLDTQPLIHIVWRDISEHKRDVERLRQSEAQLSAALRAGGLGVWRWTLATDALELDERAQLLFQTPPTKHPTFDLIRAVVHPDDLAWVGEKLADILAHHQEFGFQHRLLLPDGTVRYVDASGQVERDAQRQAVRIIGLVHDVTERVRLAEETTRLRLQQQQEVLSAILNTQEEERRRIAEALHNGVGQLLYATKLNLENLTVKSSEQRSVVMELLDEAIRATRTISFELTPRILEDFGLEVGLQEFCKRIPKRNLHVHMQLHGLAQPRPRLLDVAIYRIVQELLNNVIKHAQAQEAFVHVVHENGQVVISVEDDGVGFDSNASSAVSKGIGLAGIRQRVDLLGGTLAIDSRPGRGTIVTIELAL